MVVFLNLTIVSVGVLFSFNTYILFNLIRYFENPEDYDKKTEVPNYVYIILPILPVVLFSISTVLNLNNWTNYYIKIGEMAGLTYKNKKWINILTSIIILAHIFYTFFHIYQNFNTSGTTSYYIFISYFGISIIF